MVTDGNPEVWDYLDIDSFAKSFMMDELACDTDAGLTSMFFTRIEMMKNCMQGPHGIMTMLLENAILMWNRGMIIDFLS